MFKIRINFRVAIALAKREFLKYIRNKSRIITSMFQSLMFLGIFGMVGNVSLISAGLISQAILFSGIFAGFSIIQDKMLGFHKEIMVAPITRTTITLGKALGGTIIASIQGIILLSLTSLLGVFGYDLILLLRILAALPAILLISFMVVSLGNLLSVKMNDFHKMQFIITFLVMPMFLSSGAIIDFVGTPFYNFTLINPMTYAVDTMRWIMLYGTPALSVGLPIIIDILIIFGLSICFILLAALILRKTEAI